MSRKQQFLVIPFFLLKGRYKAGEMRQATSEVSAMLMAERMAPRFAGVAALEVIVETETGEMFDPRELVVFGDTPDFEALAA